MDYHTHEFLNYLGIQSDVYRIFVRVDTRKKRRVFGRPSLGVVKDNNFCEKLDGNVQLYVSVNLCQKVFDKPKISDVVYWTCEYIDLDCERTDHTIPATNTELFTLKPQIVRINKWLGDHGFKRGYHDFTGNGFRWLLPVPLIDLRKLSVEDVVNLNEQKKEWLKILKRETGANIDTGVGELSRITGIPGTINVKSRDARDRRRQPFRGCERVEDPALQDYVMNVEIPEPEIICGKSDYEGTARDVMDGMLHNNKKLTTLFNNAQSLTTAGKRSDFDYMIAIELRNNDVSMADCIDIIRNFGTTKARSRKDNYVENTVMNAYTKVIQ